MLKKKQSSKGKKTFFNSSNKNSNGTKDMWRTDKKY